MSAVAETILNVSPIVQASLLIVARTLLVSLGLPSPKVSQILAVTGAGRSRAYELANAIPSAVRSLLRGPGRPVLEPDMSPPDALYELRGRIIDFLIEHPGCVTTRGRRRRYSDDYRRYVLELAEEREEETEGDLASFSQAAAVPLPTLRDWLRVERPEPEPMDDEATDRQDAASARIETVLNEWEQWTGDFVPFCDHLREHLHIPYGRTLIASSSSKPEPESPSDVLVVLPMRRPCVEPSRPSFLEPNGKETVHRSWSTSLAAISSSTSSSWSMLPATVSSAAQSETMRTPRLSSRPSSMASRPQEMRRSSSSSMAGHRTTPPRSKTPSATPRSCLRPQAALRAIPMSRAPSDSFSRSSPS